MSDNVQLFPWETRDGLWAESGLSFPGDACAGAAGAAGAGAGAGATGPLLRQNSKKRNKNV